MFGWDFEVNASPSDSEIEILSRFVRDRVIWFAIEFADQLKQYEMNLLTLGELSHNRGHSRNSKTTVSTEVKISIYN